MDQGWEGNMHEEQRQKLLHAVLIELVEHGYSDVSVERSLRSSEVSRAEFAAEFGDKDGCLIAAYDYVSGEVMARTTAACDAGRSWPERIRDGLTALLAQVAADPELARAMTRSFPGIRPATYERYVSLLAGFQPYMTEGRRYSGSEGELPAEVELLAIGAAEAIIFAEVEAGRAERLPRMLPEILFSVLVPFLGPDRAADEMRSASAAP
jgi:AcrR family transcriptional regulator